MPDEDGAEEREFKIWLAQTVTYLAPMPETYPPSGRVPTNLQRLRFHMRVLLAPDVPLTLFQQAVVNSVAAERPSEETVKRLRRMAAQEWRRDRRQQ